METENDKHHPEKSNSFTTRDPAADQENNHHENHHRRLSDPNLNLPPQQDLNHNIVAESQTETQPNPQNTEPEKQQEEEEASTDLTTEEESHPPPDFDQVCQEIDQFISALSTAKGPDESDPPDLPQAMEHFPFLVEAKIANYDSTKRWNQLSEEDSSSFLDTVNRVSKLITSLNAFSSQSTTHFAPSINRAGGVLQRAMSYLEDEFRSLLEDPKVPNFDKINNEPKGSNQLEPESSTPDQEPSSEAEDNFPGYSDEVLFGLSRLAKAMITGGYEAECYQVYTVTRRAVLEETLRKLGFEKFSIDDVQKMQWDPLEREIVSWNQTFKRCAGVVFKGERKLSAAVFGDTAAGDGVFDAVTRGIMVQLLNFAAAVGMAKRSSEKLFKFLDMYETLRDVILVMDDLFVEGTTVNELKSEASLTRTRLGESMVSIFCELENSIKADTGKTPVAGGAVHPLTRYTMNYLRYACEYKDTLEQIFKEHQMIERADSATGSDYDYNSQGGGSTSQNQVNQTSVVVKRSPFAFQINKVMDLLDTNIEAKSKLYKDPLLSSIFMMNNERYVLQKVKGSPEFNELMGDTWSRKRSSDIRNYHKRYRESWGRLLNCLSHEGLTVHGKVVKPVLKERFKSFNAMFDEIHKTQSTWVVSDDQLQSELRVSIVSIVIPAYRAFLARFSQNFTPGRQTEKYIKYQADDIETYIDELFDGNAGAVGKRRP